mmetsp:Transcript_74686/g.216731  ORF Transcript_74686/g.216731 Transcript_74686/m.216731 type:complete len:743 (-) Transcript_74686:169-2397(-)|eukprot:CAMPEP_0176049360 /NCGR_PEP_ID=MMETSP0120_2-20121206/24527_1 /TAXON_ID=160619 /ORGANISM="Kryptoperidinium foliaceum, Strain CCMP 1326" /LENGTH=742 /DNA_ID=CAMNT_0017382787 /DNA_START=135 /DNA_END=2363 /DNA_ORIENTATION=+
MARAEFSIKVNNLPPRCSVDELRYVFEAAGFTNITDVYLPEKFAKQGSGFVRFSDEVASLSAVEDAPNLSIRGQQLSAELATKEKRKPLGSSGGTSCGGAGCGFAGGGKGGGKDSAFAWGIGLDAWSRMGSNKDAWSGGKGAWDIGPKGKGWEAWLGKGKGVAAFDGGGLASWAGSGFRDVVALGGSGEHSIWVGGIMGASPEQLMEAFSRRGVENMSDVYVPPGKDFGFVRFRSREEAVEALELCRDMRMQGSVLELKLSKSEKFDRSRPGEASSGCLGCGSAMWGSPGWASFVPFAAPRSSSKYSGEVSMRVSNLPADMTADGLRTVFEGVGLSSMTDVYIPKGQGGYGFLRFASQEEATMALEYDGMEVEGQQVSIAPAEGEKRSPMHAVTSGYGQAALGGFPPGVSSLGVFGGWGPTASVGSRAPSERPFEVSVKVSGLRAGTSADDLKQSFVEVGVDTMTDVYVPPNKGFGFLRFSTLHEAQAALAYSGLTVMDAPVSLELSESEKKRPLDMQMAHILGAMAGGRGPIFGGKGMGFGEADSASGEVSVKVNNLPLGMTPDELRQVFVSQGIDTMTDCYIPRDRNFGFLRFASTAEARYALMANVRIGETELKLEPAVGAKRKSHEMDTPVFQAPSKMPRRSSDFSEAAPNSDRSVDGPSVKVNNVPVGATSEALHQALLAAGCAGHITDVYVPQGDRGFAFVRFGDQGEAEEATLLEVCLGDRILGLELATSEKRRR